MPSPTTVEHFIACVERGAHDEAIATFYAPNASMRENQQPPLVEHERRVLARARSVRSQYVAPVFVAGDRVVIQGDLIAEEEFFYDSAQLVPKETGAMASGPLPRKSPRTHTSVATRCAETLGSQAKAGGISDHSSKEQHDDQFHSYLPLVPRRAGP